MARCRHLPAQLSIAAIAAFCAVLASATPLSLYFSGNVTIYAVSDPSGALVPDPSKSGQPFYGWVILDLPPPQIDASPDGTYLAARAESRRGCEALADGVCEIDYGAAPSLVTGYVINLPWESETAYPASAYLGEFANRLNLHSPPAPPSHIDLYLIQLVQAQTSISSDGASEQVSRTFTLNPATFETDDLFLSVLDYTLPPNPAAFPNCCLFFSDASSAGTRQWFGTINVMRAPEPAPIALLGIALAAMAIAGRERRQRPGRR